jgi:hydrogenase maturation factor
MHDPTEGGLAAALWELSRASGRSLVIELHKVHIPDLAAKICEHFGLNPLASIASGAMLMTVDSEDASQVCSTLEVYGIQCAEIGIVEMGPPNVWVEAEGNREILPHPKRDEIARLFEET